MIQDRFNRQELLWGVVKEILYAIEQTQIKRIAILLWMIFR